MPLSKFHAMSLWETEASTERLGTLWNMVMEGEVQIMCNSGSVSSGWFGYTTSCNVWMRQTGLRLFYVYEYDPLILLVNRAKFNSF